MTLKPTTGASTIVQDGNKVLLIKRGKEPYLGHWSLPGGSHEYGETLEECARRELKEETNLDASELKFRKVRDRITRNESGEITFHYVLATYQAMQYSGTPKAMDDAMDVGWFTHAQILQAKTTPETPEFLVEILGSDFTGNA